MLPVSYVLMVRTKSVPSQDISSLTNLISERLYVHAREI